MAVNLSGKADATLVRAAKNAAMANVPMDVSRINERVSKSYAKMTESVGKSWVAAITTVGAIGAGLITKAKKNKGKPKENFTNNMGSRPLKFPKINPEIKFDPKIKGLNIVDPAEEKVNKAGVAIKNPITGFTTPTSDGLSNTGKRFSKELDFDFLKELDFDFSEWQELPAEFVATDNDGASSNIKIANTDQFAETLRDDIYNLSGQMDEDLKAVESNVNYSSEEKKEIKKEIKSRNKRQKKDKKEVLNTMNNSNARFAEFSELLNTQLESGTLNIEASGMYGANKLKFVEAMLNNGKPIKDGSKAIQGYDEKGNLTFAYVDKNNKPIMYNGSNMTLAESDAEGYLVQQSPDRSTIDGLIDLKQIRRDYEYGTENSYNTITKTINETVKDKNSFLDFAFYQSENTDASLADTLHSVRYDNDGAPILDDKDGLASVFITALADIPKIGNKHPYDTDGDGEFTKEDYDNERNYMALVKKALSGDNLTLGKSLLKKHLQLQTAGHFDDAERINRTIDQKENKEIPPVKVPLSVQQSRQKAAAIDKVIGSKINEQGIKSLKLELGARTTVTTLRGENARKAEVADGTIQIMDSADNAYMINPNDPIDARSILYGLAKINQEDRDEQIMGIASDADDPKTGKTENDYFNMITN